MSRRCDFCGWEIAEDESSYGDTDTEGHIFCGPSCLSKYKMGNKRDTCANCNKIIVGSIVSAAGPANEEIEFCSKACFEKYNEKRAENNKLKWIGSIFG